jgi:uncharacterized protein
VKVVVDTNVLVSAFFFGGVPGRILTAWNDGHITLVISAPILAEYREVGEDLNSRYGPLDFESFAALIVMNSNLVDAPDHVGAPICSDPADDKFFTCAAAARCEIIVSGDRHLLDASGWGGIEVLRPRQFLERLALD